MRITLDGNFLNYGGTVLNRAEVSEADIPNGMVIMRNGHQYWIDAEVLRGWYSDCYEFKPVKKEVRNCYIFLLPDHAEQGFWAWWKEQNEVVCGVRKCDFEPTPKDVLEWVYAVASKGKGDNKKGTGDAR